jgi:hypothetical protein
MDFARLIELSLPYGLLLSLLMGLTFVALAYINPQIWLKDYPPDIQARFGPPSERAQRQRKVAGFPVLIFILGTIGLAIGRLAQVKGGPLVFGDVFLSTFIILLVFNLLDLLILDWLFFVTLRPGIIVLPGTEGASGYTDFAFHFQAFLKGVAGSVLAAAIAAGVALLLQALLR